MYMCSVLGFFLVSFDKEPLYFKLNYVHLSWDLS